MIILKFIIEMFFYLLIALAAGVFLGLFVYLYNWVIKMFKKMDEKNE